MVALPVLPCCAIENSNHSNDAHTSNTFLHWRQNCDRGYGAVTAYCGGCIVCLPGVCNCCFELQEQGTERLCLVHNNRYGRGYPRSTCTGDTYSEGGDGAECLPCGEGKLSEYHRLDAVCTIARLYVVLMNLCYVCRMVHSMLSQLAASCVGDSQSVRLGVQH